ncbi:saccharopine dehydrogenase [Rickenella mellea]|uniref:Saccharopine dehydrogenase [NAD(+), L-lysine-forming] n=1 Tax=Rickenella mellea TaxID=50990 RepID=A0A4Y7PMZ8_9AGAM|nr:saccharopine dehydrogenase [Rickenella mellea]
MSTTTETTRPALWLRCETKEFERRTALTPAAAKTLVESGFDIFVERDEQRIFDDVEYERVGCTLKENNSWPSAPAHIPIIGLKELPASTSPLPHTHIYFAHCYKRQAGWADVLARFHAGGGTLYDLEFLTDARGRRVAAFGFHAGFAGAAAGTLAFAEQARGNNSRLGPLRSFDTEHDLVSAVKASLGGSAKNVKALVIGALGRCGHGAVDLFRKIGLDEDNIVKWDLDETAKGGPFPEILDVDIFVNCVYLSTSIPPFLTIAQLQAADATTRRLRVVVDVSCDTANPHNPIPIYKVNTTFSRPTVDVDVGVGSPELTVVSIDHLPTLLPREASEQFSNDLLPSLLEFPRRKEERVWVNAEKLFREKMLEAMSEKGL